MKKLTLNEIIRLANSTARAAGYGAATDIQFANVKAPKVISHTSYGYRKNTDGQYVPNAYRRNFGWKNTYYQSAKTVVLMPYHIIDWTEESPNAR